MKNFMRAIMSIAMLMLLAQQDASARDLPRIVGLPADKQPEMRRGYVEAENAIESASLRISLSASLNGFVEGKVCDFCETIKVIITPETKAYQEGKEVSLIKAKTRIGRFATVFYDIESKNVNAIRW